MNRIEALIAEYCPDGVEFRALGDVCCIANGYAFKSNKYSSEGIRIIRISDVQKGYIANKDVKFYPYDSIEEIKQYLLDKDDLVMSLTGNVGRVAKITDDIVPAGLNQRVARLRPADDRVLVGYLYHFLNQDCFEEEALSNSTGGGQKNMSTTWLSKYKIPVPPLEVQRGIVEILDKFSKLEAELEAELEARRAQYSHYREQLLTFEQGGVQWIPMGEVGEFIRGNGMLKSDLQDDGFPAIHYGELHTKYGAWSDANISYVDINKADKFRKANPGDVVIVTTSEDAECVAKGTAWVADFDVAVSGEIHLYRSELNSKYVSYFLQTNKFFDAKVPHITGTKVKRISAKDMSKILIPVPPFSEQKRIADILDKFDALVNDISKGLPAELEARRKQYEHYREQLLTFKEKQAA